MHIRLACQRPGAEKGAPAVSPASARSLKTCRDRVRRFMEGQDKGRVSAALQYPASMVKQVLCDEAASSNKSRHSICPSFGSMLPVCRHSGMCLPLLRLLWIILLLIGRTKFRYSHFRLLPMLHCERQIYAAAHQRQAEPPQATCDVNRICVNLMPLPRVSYSVLHRIPAHIN